MELLNPGAVGNYAKPPFAQVHDHTIKSTIVDFEWLPNVDPVVEESGKQARPDYSNELSVVVFVVVIQCLPSRSLSAQRQSQLPPVLVRRS